MILLTEHFTVLEPRNPSDQRVLCSWEGSIDGFSFLKLWYVRLGWQLRYQTVKRARKGGDREYYLHYLHSLLLRGILCAMVFFFVDWNGSNVYCVFTYPKKSCPSLLCGRNKVMDSVPRGRKGLIIFFLLCFKYQNISKAINLFPPVHITLIIQQPF